MLKSFANEQNVTIEFLLKPKLCVLSATETQCRDQLIAQWQSSMAMSLCLYQEQQEQPLECWKNTHYGNIKFSASQNQTTIFELREINTNKIIAREVFEVLFAQTKYPRKRRNPWSFF